MAVTHTSEILERKTMVRSGDVYVAVPVCIPPFSVAGVIDALATSPAYAAVVAGRIVEVAVTVGDAASTAIVFDVLVNGTAAETITADTTGLVKTVVSIPVVVHDLLAIEITDIGTGALDNVYIELRYGTTPAAP